MRPDYWKHKELMTLVQNLLIIDPTKRYGWKEIFENPYVKNLMIKNNSLPHSSKFEKFDLQKNFDI